MNHWCLLGFRFFVSLILVGPFFHCKSLDERKIEENDARLERIQGKHKDVISAAVSGDFTSLKNLCAEDIGCEFARDDQENSALMRAMSNQNWDIARYLVARYKLMPAESRRLKHKYDWPGSYGIPYFNLDAIDRPNLQGLNALMFALIISADNVPEAEKVIELIVDAGGDVNFQDPHQQTALMRAVKVNKPRQVTFLLAKGADPNACAKPEIGLFGNKFVFTEWEDTPLIIAAREGFRDIVKLLLKAGAENRGVGCTSHMKGKTALMHAAEKGHTDVVREFMRSKADINESDMNGWTALTYALSENQTAVIKILRAAGAKEAGDDYNAKARQKEKEFCNNWVDSVPEVARPKNKWDLDRACSNLWQRGSDDFKRCTRTWRDCAKYY